MPDIPGLGFCMTDEKKISGGKLSNNFRGGTRSEYLAKYGLSRFTFVYQVPRQEDFGVVDLLCTLGNVKKPTLVYPENSFYVQVKADRDDFNLSEDSINWIIHHMDLPIFLCVADKSDDSLSFYSMSILWELIFVKTKITGITIMLNKKFDEKVHKVLSDEKKDHPDIQYKIYLGEPFMIKTLSQLESDNQSSAYNIMKAWVAREELNITSKKLGGMCSFHIDKWEQNKVPSSKFYQVYHGKDYRPTEDLLSEQLTSLAISYRSRLRIDTLPDEEKHELTIKFTSLCEFLKVVNPIRLLYIDTFIKKMDEFPLIDSDEIPDETTTPKKT